MEIEVALDWLPGPVDIVVVPDGLARIVLVGSGGGTGEPGNDWDCEVDEAEGRHDDADIDEVLDEATLGTVLIPAAVVIGGVFVFGFGLDRIRSDDDGESDANFRSFTSIISSST